MHQIRKLLRYITRWPYEWLAWLHRMTPRDWEDLEREYGVKGLAGDSGETGRADDLLEAIVATAEVLEKGKKVTLKAKGTRRKRKKGGRRGDVQAD